MGTTSPLPGRIRTLTAENTELWVLADGWAVDLAALSGQVSVFESVTLPAIWADVAVAGAAAENAGAKAFEAEAAAAAVTLEVTALETLTDGWKTTGKTTIDGGKLTADSVTATELAAKTITAAEIKAATLTSASGIFGIMDASVINAGTLNADRLNAADIRTKFMTAGKIAAGEISAGALDFMTITGPLIRSTATPSTSGGWQLDSWGLRLWKAGGGAPTFEVVAGTGIVTATGTFRTGVTGARAELSDYGTGGVLRLFSGVGQTYGALNTYTDSTLLSHNNSSGENTGLLTMSSTASGSSIVMSAYKPGAPAQSNSVVITDTGTNMTGSLAVAKEFRVGGELVSAVQAFRTFIHSGTENVSTATWTRLTAFGSGAGDQTSAASGISYGGGVAIVSRSGIYHLEGAILFLGNVTGSRNLAFLAGGQRYRVWHSVSSAGRVGITGSMDVYLAAGQSVELQAYQDSGATLTVYPDSDLTRWSIRFVSA